MLSKETLLKTFEEMGLAVEQDGDDFVHSTEGNFAPLLQTVVTIDEDGAGATLLTALPDAVPEEKWGVVCELLNLVHGQSLWNVRFHLDESGRVFSVGKHLLWSKPFNAVQFGDIFFSHLVTTARLFPCLVSLVETEETAEQAFERFFSGEGAKGTPSELQ
ncbi:hypothetical protein K2X33_12305 [bacterium]|nr:hypothetical protein [bacterium]